MEIIKPSENVTPPPSLDWDPQSNWSVSGGCLKTSVTFETADFPTVDDFQCMPASPLILTPPLDHSSPPCQIKLCFKQKYEIRQIYVRSTARVYEIYYSPSWQAADEYLCTVRCSTAERDGEILHVPSYGNGENESKTSVGESTKSNSPSETSGSSENDWVDVKNPIASYESTDRSLSNKEDFNMGSSIQDLYEATAEMNDADPCTSITIRLLSVQNKSRVFVDEVYVFADLVDPSESENQAVQMGSSSGNALMAMLVPTILQLSKSSSSQMHERITSEKHTTNAEVVPKLVDKKEATDNEQDDKLRAEQQHVMYGNRAEPDAPQLPSHYPSAPPPPVENVMPHSRIEGLLEQLVLRVSRVEDYFCRFEENILKPINSMDARLSLVEQKLEILANNSGSFGLQPGTRFSAPSFSSGESNSSSIFDDTSRDTPQMSELKESDIDSTDSCKRSDDLPAADSSPRVLPGFRITAPDLACSEDDEDGNVCALENSDVLISSGGTSLEKPKKTVSVDDALAKALSRLLATSSSKSEDAGNQVSVAKNDTTVESLPPTSEYSHFPIILAPEFTIEIQGDAEFIDYEKTYSVYPAQYLSKESGIGNTVSSERDELGTFRIPLDASLFTGREPMPTDISDRSSDKQLNISSAAGLSKILTEVDAGQITDQSCQSELNNDMLSAQGEATDKSGTPENDAVSVKCVGNEAADINAQLNFTELPVAPAVDLEFPILEVKFDSHGHSSTGSSPIESLLYDVSNIHTGTSGPECLDEFRVAQEAESTSEDGSRADDLPTDYNPLVDLSFDGAEELSNSGSGLYDILKSSNHETLASSM